MRVEHIGDATCILADCTDIMREMPDKAFELAIVDPPYGDGGGLGKQEEEQVRRIVRQVQHRGVNHAYGGRFERYAPPTRTGGTWATKYQTEGGCPSDIRHWDFAPPPEYFEELFRVSRFQIIWGGNYFSLPPSRNFIVWKKYIPETFSMAMAEYAWTNIPGNAKVFECAPQGTVNDPRFHPTQKPVALYKWLLGLYAKEGDKILDTHMGSGSSVVACADMGYPITAIEINEDYFTKACKRIEIAYRQPRLFDEPRATYTQGEL